MAIENGYGWVLMCDDDDGEMRVVHFSVVDTYSQLGWRTVKDDRPLDELKAYCRLAMGGEHERLGTVADAWLYVPERP